MNKTYHFLAGLPRSGNTLLSALLNQNTNIYSTSISPVSGLMWNFEQEAYKMEHLGRNIENKIKVNEFLSSFMDNYYKKIEKPIIIDREKSWGTPANLEIIKKYITTTPKIIFTVRDVLEILASFIRLDFNSLKIEYFNQQHYMSNYRFEKDLAAEYIMKLDGEMDKTLLSLASAFYPENKGIFHIVEYDDLVFNPDETMAKIYNFLEIPYYKHNFNKIEKIEIDNDEVIGFPKNLHDVKKSLCQSSTDISILSDYIKHKYSNMEFWRKDSIIKIKGRDF